MENLVKWLEKTHRENWILFCVVLGLVNFCAFYFIHGELGVFALKTKDSVEYSPLFLGLEILLSSLAITRILVAMDIIYLLQIWPITGDLIVLVDREKRACCRLLKKYDITWEKVQQFFDLLKKHGVNDATLTSAIDKDKQMGTLYIANAKNMLYDLVKHDNKIIGVPYNDISIKSHISHYCYTLKYPKLYLWCNFVFYTIVGLGILTFITIKWLIPVGSYFYKIICS